mmetsp:Transcript_27353/g.41392  ORF Transcript_27353/g.41392 Transcript_27353/m.41392 type:complete len:383 (-) Transcript_27353:324-1472(-)
MSHQSHADLQGFNQSLNGTKRVTTESMTYITEMPKEEEKMDVDEEMASEKRSVLMPVHVKSNKSKKDMVTEKFLDEEDAQQETSGKKKNKSYTDYEKTGRWGEVSKTDILIIVAIVLVLIAGVVTALIFLTNTSTNDKDNEEEISAKLIATETPSSAPSSLSPVYSDPSSQLKDALDLIRNVTDRPGGEPVNDVSALNDKDVSFFIEKFNNPSASPLIRSLSWILLDDPAPVGENWLLSRLGLVALYVALGGDEWTNQANWLSEKPVCEWYGVTCNRRKSKIEILKLDNNNLSGNIPDEISLLTDMFSLSMMNNHLTGTIPAIALGSVPHLTSIYLSRNKLNGTVEKELRNNGVLSTLHLAGNKFTGEWPTDWAEKGGKSFF